MKELYEIKKVLKQHYEQNKKVDYTVYDEIKQVLIKDLLDKSILAYNLICKSFEIEVLGIEGLFIALINLCFWVDYHEDYF